MSDALDYLLAARPDAMRHYFAFLKDCGSRLDPKTRALISLVTKVHAQTERGFRQYLRRALHDGCSAAEVLDALLMAFPALGLARIVWAADIIVAMDLPEFRPAALGAEGRWHDLIAADALAVGAAMRVDCDGRGLFVHRAGDADWRVYDSRCPHEATDIPAQALAGTTLTCPKHEWVFDLRSGACIAQGTRALQQWQTRIEDGRLLARW